MESSVTIDWLVATPLCKRSTNNAGTLPACVIARANSTYWHTNDVTIHICGYSIKSPAIQTKEAVGAKSLANSHQVIARLAVTQPKCS